MTSRPTLALLLSVSAATVLLAQLTVRNAKMLAINVTEAVAARQRGGCPSADATPLGRNFVLVQVRNTCPQSGSGLIGNYVVDLRSGEIWSDVERTKQVDSNHLRRLRQRLRRQQ